MSWNELRRAWISLNKFKCTSIDLIELEQAQMSKFAKNEPIKA